MKASRQSRPGSDSKTSVKSSAKKKRKQNDSGTKQERQRGKGGSNRSRKSSRSTVVMGLDLSLTATGLVVWDGERVLRRRRYKTTPARPADGLKARPNGQHASDLFSGDNEERIEWLRRKVALACDKFAPTLVVIESRNFIAKGAANAVDELQGVIKNYLHRNEILFVLVAPPTLKLEATGNGRASKLEMIAEAKQYDRSINTDDEADAMHLAALGFRKFAEWVDE